jgi:hypothetical protein
MTWTYPAATAMQTEATNGRELRWRPWIVRIPRPSLTRIARQASGLSPHTLVPVLALEQAELVEAAGERVRDLGVVDVGPVDAVGRPVIRAEERLDLGLAHEQLLDKVKRAQSRGRRELKRRRQKPLGERGRPPRR